MVIVLCTSGIILVTSRTSGGLVDDVGNRAPKNGTDSGVLGTAFPAPCPGQRYRRVRSTGTAVGYRRSHQPGRCGVDAHGDRAGASDDTRPLVLLRRHGPDEERR